MLKTIKNIITLQVLITIFLSCNNNDGSINTVLRKAGENRLELEKVISHYSKNPSDAEKLAAARFLIKNMEDWYYFDGEQLDGYFNIFEMIYEHKAKFTPNTYLYYPDKKNIDGVIDTLNQTYGPFSLSNLDLKFDVNCIKASYLINNIDMAFKVWKEQPWGKDVNFEQFCESILPYRIGNERPDYVRLELYNQYNDVLDSVRNANGDAVAACSRINDELRKGHWVWTERISFLPHFGAKTLLKHRMGVCRDYADIAVYVMRSVGIPVSIDYTPQWPFRNLGHEWNVVLNKKGKNIVFMGVESNPGVPHKDDHKKAKVYRCTFAKQPHSLAMINNNEEEIPALFTNPRFIDVSDEYFKNTDVTIQLKSKKGLSEKYAYLSVFNNSDWIPIHWGKITKKNLVTFSKMGRDIVYLPVFYKNGNTVAANLPFLLTKEGLVKYLIPDTIRKQQLNLNRKYPLISVKFRLERMVKGRFQGANTSDFKDAVDLYIIQNLPTVFYQSVDININKQFRYLRYLAPAKSNGNIAELEFYCLKDTINPLKGDIIGTSGSYNDDPAATKEKAMDGDMFSFFDSEATDYSWVGIDLGTSNKQAIKKIRFLPANDGNNVTPGNEYELLYWGNEGWVSIGRQVAKGYELIFENAPSGALFLLHNLSGGKEERIFTYEKGIQVWW